jgi:flagellar basal-body rod protein FlgG
MYTAATGMNAQQQHIDVISNNLSNVDTDGYKGQVAVFKDLMYQNMGYSGTQNSDGTQSLLQNSVGMGVRLAGTYIDTSQGNINTEDAKAGEINLAITGKGWFQVTLPNGSSGYTRNGHFVVDPNTGLLKTPEGYALDPNLTTPAPNTYTVLFLDGDRIKYKDNQGNETELGQVQIYSFDNPSALKPYGNSFFLQNDKSGQATQLAATDLGFGGITMGLEQSNVALVEEMVNLITAQRAYEANSKSIRTADDMLSITNQLKR